MSQLILGKDYNIGNRELNEDRVQVESFKSAGGLEIDIALVADGVGGFEKGEAAAQKTIDTVVQHIRQSGEQNPSRLLFNAVQAANQAVYQFCKSINQKVSSTCAIAMVVNGSNLSKARLFVANVGDSRVYLCRKIEQGLDGEEQDEVGGSQIRYKLTQLTLDHNFEHKYLIEGTMTPLNAARHPSASVLTRAIGINPSVEIDLGFHIYEQTSRENYQSAQARGQKGLPLKMGDSILVCSDGLIKLNHRTGTPFVKDEEITEVFSTEEGDRAARTLISFALGREVDDNVAIALLQTPDPSRKLVAHTIRDEARSQGILERRRMLMVFGGLVALILLIALAFGFMLQQRNQANEIAAATSAAATVVVGQSTSEAVALQAIQTATANYVQTESAETALSANQTAVAATETRMFESMVDSFTPTPSPTTTPTATPFIPPEPNQVAIAFLEGERRVLINRSKLEPVNNYVLVQFNPRKEQADIEQFNEANMYISPGSAVRVIENSSKIDTVLDFGSTIFLTTNDYEDGAEVVLNDHSDIVLLGVTQSCLSIEYPIEADTLELGCFKGNCGYFFGDARFEVAQGKLMSIPLNGSNPTEFDISPQIASRFNNMLSSNFPVNGVDEAEMCTASYIPEPTPTFTPVPVNTATALPVETAAPESSSSPGAGNENDPDGDGIEVDLCPAEPGFAHTCGCPEDKVPGSCGGSDGGGNNDDGNGDGGGDR